MLTLSKKVEEEVLTLPANERLSLIDTLIMSLNLPTQTEVDKLWAEEAEKRIKELNEGNVQGIPGDEVFAEMRNSLSE